MFLLHTKLSRCQLLMKLKCDWFRTRHHMSLTSYDIICMHQVVDAQNSICMQFCPRQGLKYVWGWPLCTQSTCIQLRAIGWLLLDLSALPHACNWGWATRFIWLPTLHNHWETINLDTTKVTFASSRKFLQRNADQIPPVARYIHLCFHDVHESRLAPHPRTATYTDSRTWAF